MSLPEKDYEYAVQLIRNYKINEFCREFNKLDVDIMTDLDMLSPFEIFQIEQYLQVLRMNHGDKEILANWYC